MTPRFNARRRPNDRSSSRLVRLVLTGCSSQATMEHNVMGGPRRGVMSARWSMRPSTYDRMMRGSNQRRYYQNSGYFNFGYWGAGAKSQQEASDALVDQMVARIGNKSGRILDVACGLGDHDPDCAPARAARLGSLRPEVGSD